MAEQPLDVGSTRCISVCIILYSQRCRRLQTPFTQTSPVAWEDNGLLFKNFKQFLNERNFGKASTPPPPTPCRDNMGAL